MTQPKSTPPIIPRYLLTLCLILGSLLSAPAQNQNFDPSDVYFQAWLVIREAEKLETARKPAEAHQAYQRAKKLFDNIALFHPLWKPDLVKMRLTSTSEALERLLGAALAKEKQTDQSTQGLVRDLPAPSPAKTAIPSPLRPAPKPPKPLNTKEKAHIADLEKRVSTLTAQIRDLSNSEKNKDNQLSLAKANLQTQYQELQKLKTAKPSTQPTQNNEELTRLQKQITQLNAKINDLSTSDQEKSKQLSLAKTNLQTQQTELQKLKAAQARPVPQLLPAPSSNAQELARLQKRILQIEAELSNTRNDRDAKAASNRRILAQLKDTQAKLGAAPVQAEIDSLNRKLKQVTAEKETLLLSLKNSNIKLKTAIAAANQLKQERDQALAEKTDIQKHLTRERNAGNEVVRGLRTQLKAKDTFIQKQAELLTQAHQESENLQKQLAESNEVIADLKIERNSILKERDQMANLLNLNEADRVQKMVDQNMELGRQLREARESIQILSDDNNATKDQLINAKHSLAVAKSRILNMREERAAQDQRFTELKEKLQTLNEQLAVTKVTPDSDPASAEEIRTLKEIIQRQLLAQEHRRQKTTVLLAQLHRLSNDNPDFNDSLVALSKAEFQLTDEEEELLSNKKIDQQFVAANRATPAERKRAASALQAKRSVMNNAALRCYKGERYRAAGEIYEMVLEISPGHIPSLLNLGTVNLKLENYEAATQAFENAITLRVNQPLPYAHYMLGVIDYAQGNVDQAREKLETSLTLHADNAKAHVYLGIISGLDDPYSAKQHFEKAIEIDPSLADPHYNLAYLAHLDGNQKEALTHYRTLLDKGGQPDPEFEKKLRK